MSKVFADQQLSLAEQHRRYEATLSRLQRMSPLHDLFQITTDGHLGAISGFRVGRESDSTDWHETNSGLGQIVLLLETVRKRNGLLLAYQLLPLGSYSRIKKQGDPNVLDVRDQSDQHPPALLPLSRTHSAYIP